MIEKIKQILHTENISFDNITKSTSGFTNEVFFVDNKYVIKVVAARSKPEKIQKEIAFYKNVKLPFIPEYVSSGKIDNLDYLIIKKINGDSLYSIWHKLDNHTRKKACIDIAKILCDFHKNSGEFLTEKYVIKDWILKWQKSFSLNINILEKRGFDVEFLKDFQNTKLDKIMSEQKLGLVYNDAHFDNFILSEDKLYLIDFDRVLFGSIDYELLILKSMLDNPCKFASEVDEPNVKIEDYKNIYEIIKETYADMFEFEFLDDRIFIYQFIYNLGNAYEYDRNEWIKTELEKFKTRFCE